MNEIILSGIITILTTVIGSIISYFSAKKKYKVEVDSGYIKNIEDAMSAYTKLKDGILKDLNDAEEKNNILEEENLKNKEERRLLNDKIDNLTHENKTLKNKVDTLTDENIGLRKVIVELKSTVTTLSKQVEEINLKFSTYYETRVKESSTAE